MTDLVGPEGACRHGQQLAIYVLVESFGWVGGGDPGPMLGRERHVGEDVFAGTVHHLGKFRYTPPNGIGDLVPLLAGGIGRFLASAPFSTSPISAVLSSVIAGTRTVG